jgi:hypothetical protein
MMVYKNFVNFLNYIGFSFVIFYVSQPKCMVVEYEAGITFRLALARGNVYDVRCPAEPRLTSSTVRPWLLSDSNKWPNHMYGLLMNDEDSPMFEDSAPIEPSICKLLWRAYCAKR